MRALTRHAFETDVEKNLCGDTAASRGAGHCARASRVRRRRRRKPHGAVRESLQIGSWAERAVRSVADASHAAGHPERRRRRLGSTFSLQLATASSRTDDGGTDRLGHAGTSLERCDGDDRDARGARAEDDTSFRPAKLVHARVSGADARVVFSRSTVWRLGHPSADPRPADSRAPPSAISSPTAAVRAEQGVS